MNEMYRKSGLPYFEVGIFVSDFIIDYVPIFKIEKRYLTEMFSVFSDHNLCLLLSLPIFVFLFC